MSLHIYIAHSGEHLSADPVSFASYVLLMLPDQPKRPLGAPNVTHADAVIPADLMP